jgi:hypothetical protein
LSEEVQRVLAQHARPRGATSDNVVVARVAIGSAPARHPACSVPADAHLNVVDCRVDGDGGARRDSDGGGSSCCDRCRGG